MNRSNRGGKAKAKPALRKGKETKKRAKRGRSVFKDGIPENAVLFNEDKPSTSASGLWECTLWYRVPLKELKTTKRKGLNGNTTLVTTWGDRGVDHSIYVVCGFSACVHATHNFIDG